MSKKKKVPQCEENGELCGSQEPYKPKIMAGAVLCGGCGRRRKAIRYVAASQVAALFLLIEPAMHVLENDNQDHAIDGAKQYLDKALLALMALTGTDYEHVENDAESNRILEELTK